MVRLVVFLFLLCMTSRVDAQILIDTVIAVVSGDAVTRSELENELGIAAIMESSIITNDRVALGAIINRKFVLQESKRLGIVVAEPNGRVAEKIAEIRKKYDSDAAFQTVLQRHRLEDEALKAWIYEQLVYDEFFRRIFFNALNSAEIATLAKSYYDANSAEFIVPPTIILNALSIVIPKDASEAEKQRAEGTVQQLYARLQQGETFETVREVYEAQLTIELEVLTLAADTPLGVIAAELSDSDRSALLRISDGYQIVERIQNNPARQKTYEEVSEEIIDRIQQEKAEAEFTAWLVQQRQEVSWHILGDALDQENTTK
ncbi:MAG: peptidyl-prolyl cis-trans isomerase [Candidatus Poribacteria bacterium]|nr:peptidyl-prolyl cis-trans isomerase [Candidatus Poribacteria bacterium]